MRCPHCGIDIEESSLYELGDPIEAERQVKSGVVLSIRLDGVDADGVFLAAGDRGLDDFGREALVEWAARQLQNIGGPFTQGSTTILWRLDNPTSRGY